MTQTSFILFSFFFYFLFGLALKDKRFGFLLTD